MDFEFGIEAFIFKLLIVVWNLEFTSSYLFFGLPFSYFGGCIYVIVLIHLYVIVPLVQRGVDGGQGTVFLLFLRT